MVTSRPAAPGRPNRVQSPPFPHAFLEQRVEIDLIAAEMVEQASFHCYLQACEMPAGERIISISSSRGLKPERAYVERPAGVVCKRSRARPSDRAWSSVALIRAAPTPLFRQSFSTKTLRM